MVVVVGVVVVVVVVVVVEEVVAIVVVIVVVEKRVKLMVGVAVGRQWWEGMWAKTGNRGGVGVVVEVATVVEVEEVGVVVEVVVGTGVEVEVLLVEVVGADNLWKNEVSKRDIYKKEKKEVTTLTGTTVRHRLRRR